MPRTTKNNFLTRSTVLLPLLCIGLPLGATDCAGQVTNPVVQWNRVLLQLVRTPGLQPATVHATRNFAMMHAAIYDAVNAIDGASQPYAVDLRAGAQGASQEAAAIAAAHEVLVQLYPASQSMFDLQMQQALGAIPDGTAKTHGLSIGQTVGDRILALRAGDGSNLQPVPYVFGSNPGDYQSTPPNFPPQPQFTHWPGVKPFAIQRADQFRSGPPPALTSRAYTDSFQEVKSLGVTNSLTATPDQTLAGQFWNGAIQNYWNEIAQSAALNATLTTAQSARLFALLNLALADSVIAFYDAKYTYNLWRPVTAIRSAETDGNPDTAADPAWLPEAGKTAADPSYPGAHAVLSAAGALILDQFFGGDQASLTVTSEVLPGIERSFTSFSAAAQEAAFSRIYAGQHYRFDLTAGQQMGRAIAEFVGQNQLALASQPRISIATLSGSQVQLRWTGPATTFSIQQKLSFSDPNWIDLQMTTNLSATISATGTTGFYRVLEH